MMHPPLVGIAGGFGPSTSADFCVRLVRHAQCLRSDAGPSFIMDSVPLDMDVATRCIAGEEHATHILIDAANAAIARLAAAGAKAVAVPCNSLHAYPERYRIPEGVEFVHIADATLKRIRADKRTKIGFLSSSMTVRSGFYFPLLQGAGVEYLLPSAEEQESLDAAISQYVSTGDVDDAAVSLLARLLDRYAAEGAQATVLACTDIAGMLMHASLPDRLPLIDSLDALAEECARRSF